MKNKQPTNKDRPFTNIEDLKSILKPTTGKKDKDWLGRTIKQGRDWLGRPKKRGPDWLGRD